MAGWVRLYRKSGLRNTVNQQKKTRDLRDVVLFVRNGIDHSRGKIRDVRLIAEGVRDLRQFALCVLPVYCWILVVAGGAASETCAGVGSWA